MYPWQAAAVECGEQVRCATLLRSARRVAPLCMQPRLLHLRRYRVSNHLPASPPALQFNNLVYCAPTSGGKSLVAEVLMVRRLMLSLQHIPQQRRSKPVRAGRVWTQVALEG